MPGRIPAVRYTDQNNTLVRGRASVTACWPSPRHAPTPRGNYAMTPNDPSSSAPTPAVEGYKRMLERVKNTLQELETAAGSRLERALDMAKDKALELGELTREEADKVAEYLRRDMEDAANYLAGPSAQEFAAWLRFDVEQIEERILESFLSAADQTKLELMRLEQRSIEPAEYRTGEVTGFGTLVCDECGKSLHFYEPGRIPPCPSCRNTRFSRSSE